MRPSTRTGQFPPAVGYGRFVGRVGALALFLGVGTALGMPAASAEGDDSSRSGPASSSAASPSARSSSDSARGPSARPARATRSAAHRAATAPQSLASAPRGVSITSSAKDDPQAPVALPASSAAAIYTRRPAAVTPRRPFAAGPVVAEPAAGDSAHRRSKASNRRQSASTSSVINVANIPEVPQRRNAPTACSNCARVSPSRWKSTPPKPLI